MPSYLPSGVGGEFSSEEMHVYETNCQNRHYTNFQTDYSVPRYWERKLFEESFGSSGISGRASPTDSCIYRHVYVGYRCRPRPGPPGPTVIGAKGSVRGWNQISPSVLLWRYRARFLYFYGYGYGCLHGRSRPLDVQGDCITVTPLLPPGPLRDGGVLHVT